MADYDLSLVGSALEFDPALYLDGAMLWIDASHFILAHQGASQDGFIRVMTIDGSGNISEVGTALEFDTTQGMDNALIAIDSTHFMNIWRGSAGDGYAQVFSVNTSTWAVTAHGTALEFDITNLITPAVVAVDSTHFLVAWGGSGDDGYAQILEVNTSTWAVTALGAAIEHDTARGEFNDLFQIDSTHYFLGYTGVGNQAFAKVLAVNTSTWAVTQPASSVQLSSGGGQDSGALQIDSTHYLVTWTNVTAPYDVKAQVVTVNTSTWAITTEGTAITVGQGILAGSHSHLMWVGDVAVIAWRDASSNGRARALSVDGSYNVSVVGTADLVFDSSGVVQDPIVTEVSASRGILIWSGTDTDGFIQAFDIALPTGGTTEVLKTMTILWSVRQQQAASRSATWAVRARATTTRVVAYGIRTVGDVSRSISWGVRAASSTTRSLAWTVRTRASALRTITWDVEALAGLVEVIAYRSLSWSTRQRSTASRSLSWLVRAQQSALRVLRWDVREATASPFRALSWSARESIGTLRSVRWAQRIGTSSQRLLVWSARSSSTASRSITWSARKTETAARTIRWDVESALIRITVIAYRTLTWDARALAVAPRSVSWATRSRVSISRSLRWHVRHSETATWLLMWATRSATQATKPVRWAVRLGAGTTRGLRWGVRMTREALRPVRWASRLRSSATRLLRWLTESNRTPVIDAPTYVVVEPHQTYVVVEDTELSVKLDTTGTRVEVTD